MAVLGVLALSACSAAESAPDVASTPRGPSAAGERSDDADAAAVGAWVQVLQARLVVPPLPSFTVPTDVFDRRERRVARLLDVKPGLYRGIGVVDARCKGGAGTVNAADRARATAEPRAGHYEDAELDVTVQANGAGVYESGDLRISVGGDGSGEFYDGETKVSIRADGSGVYRDPTRSLNVEADGSGSYDDETLRLYRNRDGSAGYRDGDSRVLVAADGTVTRRGDPAHVKAALQVLRSPLPSFPLVPPARLLAAPVGRSCGSVVRLDATVLFDSDSAVLRTESREVLARVARLLAALSHPAAQVNGHTDRVGTRAHGLELSRRRAAAVKDALVRAGTPPKSLTPVGYGESRPLHREVTAAGEVDESARQLNRRVEIVLLDRP